MVPWSTPTKSIKSNEEQRAVEFLHEKQRVFKMIIWFLVLLVAVDVAFLCFRPILDFGAWFTFFGQMVSLCMGMYPIAHFSHWDHRELWKMFRGVPVRISPNDKETISWVEETIPTQDYYMIMDQNFVIFKHASHATAVKLMRS